VIVNRAKANMMEGRPAFGYALELGSPIAAELLAATGIDFIMLDTQHGSFGPDSTISALMAVSAGGAATPMARVAHNDYTLIGRLLDEGALGIVVPMVHTPEEAHAAAEACRFPPLGTRSWGWGRAGRSGDDYADAVNAQVFVAVQIESAEAVANAEAILATLGVDGCWIGPSDLALSLERRAEVRPIWHDGAWLRARLPTSVSAWSWPWTPGWHRVKRPVCLVSISARSTAGGAGPGVGNRWPRSPAPVARPSSPPLTTRDCVSSSWPIRMPPCQPMPSTSPAPPACASVPRT
jgi:2-keto-3-deoxy-L-rhamnonate aldolase RhmA